MINLRNIVALFVISTLLPLLLVVYQIMFNTDFDYDLINDEMAIVQLREELLIGYNLDFNSDSIRYKSRNKEYELYFVNNRLILTPGTQIILNDIDSGEFINKDDLIYLKYERNGNKYEQVLCQSQWLYIDDFSDCDGLFSVDDNSVLSDD